MTANITALTMICRRHHHRHRQAGGSWQWWYDRETYITAHRTPGGGMYRFTYNEDHFPVNIELPGGRTVAYEYDIQEPVVKTTDPEGPGDADAVEREVRRNHAHGAGR
ncbi:Rhs family protein [Salmonella enterica subsp. enterica]|nr:Rhs family protein [Salmonella enterica subsp. enterica]